MYCIVLRILYYHFFNAEFPCEAISDSFVFVSIGVHNVLLNFFNIKSNKVIIDT